MRLLSPFMPFITEEIWHALYDDNPPAKSIAMMSYPPVQPSHVGMQIKMELVQSLIVEIRALRKEAGVEEKAVGSQVELRIDGDLKHVIAENIAIVERLARVNEVRFVAEIATGLSKHSTATSMWP